eukprot:COSAG05_NODE_1461_length_4825_cov_2.722810_1_plen_612_part_00
MKRKASAPFDHPDSPAPLWSRARPSPRKRQCHATHSTEVLALKDALQSLKDAEKARVRAERMKSRTLEMLGRALPAVELMVEDTAACMAAHSDLYPSKATNEAHKEHQLTSLRAAGVFREVMQANDPGWDYRGLRHSAEQLLSAATVVDDARKQLHAALSARSDAHNSKRSIALRVLAIDRVRALVLGHLSLRNLYAIRRVSAEFFRWSVAETSSLPALPCVNMYSGGLGAVRMVEMGRLQTDVKDAKHAMDEGALACSGRDGSIYCAGGCVPQERDYCAVSDVSMWRPAARGSWRKGSWQRLPSMIACRMEAKACVVQLNSPTISEQVEGFASSASTVDGGTAAASGAGEVLVVLGGTGSLSAEPLQSCEMLVDGAWQSLPQLPTPRVKFGVCGLPRGRVAVAGGRQAGDAGWLALDVVDVLDLTTRRWTALPRLRRPRVFPRVSTYGEALVVVGGVSEPYGGNHIPACEILRSCDPPPSSRTFKEQRTTSAHQQAAGGGSAASCADWQWQDIPGAELPTPDENTVDEPRAFTVRGCLVTVQAPAGVTIDEDLDPIPYILDFEVGKWFVKGEKPPTPRALMARERRGIECGDDSGDDQQQRGAAAGRSRC